MYVYSYLVLPSPLLSAAVAVARWLCVASAAWRPVPLTVLKNQNNRYELHDVIQVAIDSGPVLFVSSHYICPTDVATLFELTSFACQNSAMVTSCLCGMVIGLYLVCIAKEYN